MGARTRRTWRRRARRAAFSLFLLVLLAAAAVAYAALAPAAPLDPGTTPPPPPAAEGTLRVHYLDVGQGDATIWELPDGSLVLYDCGPPADDAAPSAVVAYLRDALGRASGARIHALVASHGHLDHVGGCEEVLSEYDVAHVVDVWYDGDDAPASYRRFLDGARAEGAVLHTLMDVRGGAIPLTATAEAAGVRAEVLWPDRLPSSWDRIAEASIVVRLSHGDAAFCFQGDIERAQEQEIAQLPRDMTCDAYLVGHHGSRYASDSIWLSVMDPAIAIVSFGDNSYGHPTSDALCRVQESGATVYATHRAGDVVLESTGAGGVRVVGDERAETNDYCASGASYWP